MKRDKYSLAVGQNCKRNGEKCPNSESNSVLHSNYFLYLYNYGHLRKKPVEGKWHGKCTVFNPVEPFRRHIYGTYLVFTATNLIAREERI